MVPMGNVHEGAEVWGVGKVLRRYDVHMHGPDAAHLVVDSVRSIHKLPPRMLRFRGLLSLRSNNLVASMRGLLSLRSNTMPGIFETAARNPCILHC